jgi:Flp pilus assembly pilin Flp
MPLKVKQVAVTRKRPMKRSMTRLLCEVEAQDLIEYALLSALLAVACITGILQLTQIINFFDAVGNLLSRAI